MLSVVRVVALDHLVVLTVALPAFFVLSSDRIQRFCNVTPDSSYQQQVLSNSILGAMNLDAQLQGALEAYHALTPDQQSIFSQLSATPSPSTTPQSLESIDMSSPVMYQTPQQAPRVMAVAGRRVSRPRARQNQAAYHKKRPLNAFMAFRCKCLSSI